MKPAHRLENALFGGGNAKTSALPVYGIALSSFHFVSFLSFSLLFSLCSFFISRATTDKCAWTANGKELLPSCALAPFTSHFLNAGSI